MSQSAGWSDFIGYALSSSATKIVNFRYEPGLKAELLVCLFEFDCFRVLGQMCTLVYESILTDTLKIKPCLCAVKYKIKRH